MFKQGVEYKWAMYVYSDLWKNMLYQMDILFNKS